MDLFYEKTDTNKSCTTVSLKYSVDKPFNTVLKALGTMLQQKQSVVEKWQNHHVVPLSVFPDMSPSVFIGCLKIKNLRE